MMKILKSECDALFLERHPEFVSIIGNKNIMDETLLWCSRPMVCLYYFRCVCEIFKKYRLSFKPKKCDFFKQRFEWLGHDMRPLGNSPDESKFDLINDWPRPTFAQSLSSFIGLVTFYNKYIPLYDQLLSLIHI